MPSVDKKKAQLFFFFEAGLLSYEKDDVFLS